MADNVPEVIYEALDDLDSEVLERSGSIFYSGRGAFSKPSPLYMLGLNPGGDPVRQATETVEAHRGHFRSGNPSWSAYADESWEGAAPGTWGMQPRVLHMLAALGLDPQGVPASNVVFARSGNEAALRSEKDRLLTACWPVHEAVLGSLGIKIVLCFGKTAGRWVRKRLAANDQIDQYSETNNRGWVSEAHQSVYGQVVITTTHPSRADWSNPSADPTPLIRRVLSYASRG